MNILLIAEEAAGLRVLTELKRRQANLVAVMATQHNGSSKAGAVWNAATRMGVETWPASLVKKPALADRIREKKVDLILNVHSLYIIEPHVLSAARIGVFNLHPGPLPKYAGLNAPSWAIYNGETEHGVTLHRVEPAIDTGPVAFQKRFTITDEDTGLTVSRRCVEEGIPLIKRLLEIAANDPERIPQRSQELSQRRYFGRSGPQEGKICWQKTAREVFNFVRACDYAPFDSPWGKPKCSRRGNKFYVTKCRLTGIETCEPPGTIVHDSSEELMVACSDQWLQIEKLSSVESADKGPNLLLEQDRFDVL